MSDPATRREILGLGCSRWPLALPSLGACTPWVFSSSSALLRSMRGEPPSGLGLYAHLFPCKQIPPCGIVAIMGKRLIYFQFCNVGRLLQGLCAFSSHMLLLLSTFQIPSAPKCGAFYLRGGDGWGGIISIVTFSNGARLT